ncbi:MAG: hypothetical protein ACRDTM_11885, partial [Micromonosporaceae bacterium]
MRYRGCGRISDVSVSEPDLGHHGDAELAPGLVDLAVNVRVAPMPPWLASPIAASLGELAPYPDQGPMSPSGASSRSTIT